MLVVVVARAGRLLLLSAVSASVYAHSGMTPVIICSTHPIQSIICPTRRA